MKRKQIEAVWQEKPKVSRKSLTELGLAMPNKVGIKPQLNENGRPSLYNPDMMPQQAFIQCAQYGATLEEMGNLWGVTAQTVSSWIEQYKEFAEAVRQGRDAFTTQRIEASLYKKALGYFYEEVTVKETSFKTVNKDGTSTIKPITEVTKVQRHVPASDTAIIFALKNLAPHRWKDRQETLNLYGNIGDLKVRLTNFSVDELKQLRNDVKMISHEAVPVQGDFDS